MIESRFAKFSTQCHLAVGFQVPLDPFWIHRHLVRKNVTKTKKRPDHLPAVLVEGEDVALVLDAGDAADVAVARGEQLVVEVAQRSPSAVRVLRPVVPQQRHHHLAVGVVLPQRRHLLAQSQNVRKDQLGNRRAAEPQSRRPWRRRAGLWAVARSGAGGSRGRGPRRPGRGGWPDSTSGRRAPRRCPGAPPPKTARRTTSSRWTSAAEAAASASAAAASASATPARSCVPTNQSEGRSPSTTRLSSAMRLYLILIENHCHLAVGF